jgi:cell division protein ZapA
MADVRLTIAGRFYDVNTSDGQEQQLIKLASLVDEKARAVVGTTETRQLLFAALMLADELQEASAGVPKADPASEALREELAAAQRQIQEMELAAANQAEQLAAAEAAAAEAASALANGANKPNPAHGTALSALADRIEQLADKFEQLV